MVSNPTLKKKQPNKWQQNKSGKEKKSQVETYDIKVCQVITYDATPMQIRPLWLNIAR